MHAANTQSRVRRCDHHCAVQVPRAWDLDGTVSGMHCVTQGVGDGLGFACHLALVRDVGA